RRASESPPPPMLLLPASGSTREYVAAFGASSRVVIVVSQPTRLACVELAKFTASLVASSSSSSSSADAAAHVGGRVGYAVGGDACFSSATEIVFSTPGYIVNALQHRSGALSPTTLVIDEAHCRDLETDLLLAWAKQQLHGGGRPQEDDGSARLRQLVLMSATLPVEQMVAYFTPRAVANGDARQKAAAAAAAEGEGEHNGEARARCAPQILRVDGPAVDAQHESGDAKGGSGGNCTRPFRVEEYFLDDLPDALEASRILQADTRKGASSPSHPASSSSSSSSSGCPLLSIPARRVTASLGHFFSYTRFGADIYSHQARALAQFLLFALQSLAVASQRLAADGRLHQQQQQQQEDAQRQHPDSLLVFLPGFAEISLVLQSLEMLCRPATVGGARLSTQQPSSSGSVTFLQYEQWTFSVALLHATAIGSPQQQLDESTGPFPHRIILSTTVAESSVTIPNVRCVIDSCLERRFFADPVTGVMLRSTAVASASSVRQRGGR
ncbi:putative helicase, partial [Trypanosoma grayi]|uniref:putative helicase n=1 Tax=Trypanosoma grayi TaxID=71804 RepID=UPI0004F4B769